MQSWTYLGLVSGLALALGIGAGCAVPRIVIEQGEGLTPPPAWRTWDWAREGQSVIAVPPGEVGILHPQVVELVEGVLRERGFQRTHRHPDLLVTYRLEIKRTVVISEEPRAQQSIWGVSLKGSYHVGANNKMIERTYERGRLWIGLTSTSDSSLLWAGRFDLKVRNRLEPHLEQAVAKLLARLPTATQPPIPPDPRTPSMFASQGEEHEDSASLP